MGNIKKFDLLSIGLILISSLLMGIWVVQSTIALRNILLIVGSVIALWMFWEAKKTPALSLLFDFKRNIPLSCVALFFLWVLLHYCFNSNFSVEAARELKGVWMRSFLAVLIGLGTGVGLCRHPKGILGIWLGIFACFTIIYWQYIPRAFSARNYFFPDYEGYIVYGKINAVLIGIILLSGLAGGFFDTLRIYKPRRVLYSGILYFGGLLIVLYAFVFIFDARNGIGLTTFIFILSLGAYLEKMRTILWQKRKAYFLGHLFAIILASILMFIFINQQIKRNPGWSYFLEDASIAMQVDKYTQWQNSNTLYAYPITDSGRMIRGNNYERIAWFVAGAKLISHYPLGIGVLKDPFLKTLQLENVKATAKSTHSGWIDLGLSFGIPGIALLWATILSIFIISLRAKGCFKYTVFFMASTLFILYFVGELSNNHAVEVLFFWLGCLSVLAHQNEEFADKKSSPMILNPRLSN